MPAENNRPLPYTDQAIRWFLLLERVGEDLRREIFLELERLERSLVHIITESFPRGFSFNAQLRMMGTIQTTRDKIREIYRGIQNSFFESLEDIAIDTAEKERQIFFTLFGKEIKTPSREDLRKVPAAVLITGILIREWWERQAGDLHFRLTALLRQQATNRATLSRIIGAITGSPESGYRDGLMSNSQTAAAGTIRSGVAGTGNRARMETWRLNGQEVDGIQQVSILDSRTSKICLAYAFKIWDLDGIPVGHSLPFNDGPPRHFNCRSFVIPIVQGQQQNQFTAEDWLDSLTKRELDEVLGAGRAELWRAGRLSLSDLVDPNGRPLTLAELRQNTR